MRSVTVSPTYFEAGDSLKVRNQPTWYILWSAMLLVSAGNSLVHYPIFSGNSGFLFSVLLAGVAAMQLFRGVKFLGRKESALAAGLLCLFGTGQMTQWVYTLRPSASYRGFDFSAYYLAAKVVSNAPGHNLYDLPLYPDGRMNLNAPADFSSAWQAAALHYHVTFAAPFIYPPFFAVVVKPLAHLPFNAAYTACQIFSVLLLGAAVLLALNLGGVRMGRQLALMMGVGLFSYFPLGNSLFMGQIDSLILFLLTAGVWLLAKNRNWLSALSFAAATLIKLTPVLTVPVLIFHRRWKWLVAYIASMCGLLLFSVWQAGWEMHREFWVRVLPSISCGAPVYQNSSLVAYVQAIFLGQVPNWDSAPQTLPSHACVVSRLVGFTVYFLMLLRFYLKRRSADITRDLVIMALLGLVVSPISWWHHYVIALLPFVYLWCVMPEKGDRLLSGLFLLVGTNIAGFSLLIVENHLAQLILAGIVPCMSLALVYFRITPRIGQEPSTS